MYVCMCVFYFYTFFDEEPGSCSERMDLVWNEGVATDVVAKDVMEEPRND